MLLNTAPLPLAVASPFALRCSWRREAALPRPGSTPSHVGGEEEGVATGRGQEEGGGEGVSMASAGVKWR